MLYQFYSPLSFLKSLPKLQPELKLKVVTIQELYIEEEKKEGKVEDEEVILVKLYKVSTVTSSSSKTSFIMNEVENLIKYMKFVQSPTQTRLFKPPPHCQSLKSRGEHDPAF